MGLTKEYREEVEDIERSVESVISRHQASRVKKILDKVLPLALLGVLFLIMTAFVIPVSQRMATWINYLNWAVIVYFAARLAVEFRLATSSNEFVHEHWLDFMLVVPAFSVLREVKVAKLLEELEILSIDTETVIGSAALSRLGIAGQITRIIRIVKRSFGL